MDGLPKEVKFSFADVASDGVRINEPWQVYLRIVGRFSVSVGERILYQEEAFCVVEFAIKSQLWLKRVSQTQEDFIYTSQESEEPGLFWIKRFEGGRCIGSVYQEYEESNLFPFESLAAALSEYFNHLRTFVAEAFGTDLAEILAWADANQVR